MQDSLSAAHGLKWRWAIWLAIGFLLLAPLMAMQFTREVAWDGADFAYAALLLIGAGLTYEVTVKLTQKTRLRAVIGALIIGAVLLIWADAAVGVF